MDEKWNWIEEISWSYLFLFLDEKLEDLKAAKKKIVSLLS